MSAPPSSTGGPSRSSGSSALVTRLTARTLTSNIASSPRRRPLRRRHTERATGVVDQGIHGAGGGEVVPQRIDLGLIGEIGGEDVGAGLGGERGEPVGRRATPTTSQPRSRNRRSVAAPIPELAPVTTTRFALIPILHCQLRSTVAC